MDDPPKPLILIDECMPSTVATFFASRGFPVAAADEAFARRPPDRLMRAVAEQEAGIVANCDNDWRKLLQRAPSGSKWRLGGDRLGGLFRALQAHDRAIRLGEKDAPRQADEQ
ncbi:MAG TPA: hypothetical protein VFQ80_08570, partial [Thermomicrobiales bacterium]|nr:hypothetical protein [Thermomicrobiales bacterium]